MDPEFEKEHFVFTVSILESNPAKVIVSINTETYQLRSFERMESSDLIMLEGIINQDSPNFIGNITLSLGEVHIKTDSMKKIREGSLLLPGLEELKKANFGKIRPDLYSELIRPEILNIINVVKTRVFKSWWEPPLTLPHLMSALDDSLGLNVLEGQGRVKNGQVDWCKVYGAKGSEEKERVGEEMGAN